MEVTKREFARNIYKYLKEGTFVVTNQGKNEFVVTIAKICGEIPIDKETHVHGCGCKKADNKVLCQKHGRY